MPGEHDETLALARRIAAEAGAVLASGVGRAHAAELKRAPTDLVTEFDRRSETLLVEGIRARYPQDRVIAEEGGEVGGGGPRRWLIDPLDGTTNFAHGLPFFCVSVAVEEGGQVIVGVIEAPALGWSFWAASGGGAWLRHRDEERPLRVSEAESLGAALLATGFPYDRQTSAENNFAEFVALQRVAQGVRRVGAAALDLAMVAAGWMDGYWEMKLKPWDLAAGSLLVTEAGGTVSAWSGGPFQLDRGEAVASNGRIHAQLVAALGTVSAAGAKNAT